MRPTKLSEALKSIGLRYPPLLAIFGVLCLQVATPAPAEDGGVVIIPTLTEGIAGKRIGWEFNDIAATLHRAADDGKPVVVVLVAARCGWCRAYVTHTLRCSAVNSLAGKAHFVLLTDGDKLSAETKDFIERVLKHEGFPATYVFKVSEKSFSLVVKIDGFVGENKLLGALRNPVGPPSTEATPSTSSQAAIGLPQPQACGNREVDDSIAKTLPGAIQYGIRP